MHTFPVLPSIPAKEIDIVNYHICHLHFKSAIQDKFQIPSVVCDILRHTVSRRFWCFRNTQTSCARLPPLSTTHHKPRPSVLPFPHLTLRTIAKNHVSNPHPISCQPPAYITAHPSPSPFPPSLPKKNWGFEKKSCSPPPPVVIPETALQRPIFPPF